MILPNLPALGSAAPRLVVHFAETWFLVNSRLAWSTSTPWSEAPSPEVTGYFAEFLRESCLAPLGILYLPTCVGFGYRYPFVEGRSSFSWEYGMGYFNAVAPWYSNIGSRHFLYPFLP